MKVILATQRSDYIEQTHERRDALDAQWHLFMSLVDCILIPVPNNKLVCLELLRTIPIDGILLTGGNTPVKYGGDCEQRDVVDELLIQHAITHKVPLIGVCRGMQSIALHYGSTLKKIPNHVRTMHYVGGDVLRTVNSYHNWAIDSLGADLEICGQSDDGCIEKIISKQDNIIGIMWHPERNKPFVSNDLQLFKETYW